MYDPMPTTDIALLLRHGMLYKKLVASVTKMLDHYSGYIWKHIGIKIVDSDDGIYNYIEYVLTITLEAYII